MLHDGWVQAQHPGKITVIKIQPWFACLNNRPNWQWGNQAEASCGRQVPDEEKERKIRSCEQAFARIPQPHTATTTTTTTTLRHHGHKHCARAPHDRRQQSKSSLTLAFIREETHEVFLYIREGRLPVHDMANKVTFEPTAVTYESIFQVISNFSYGTDRKSGR